LAYPAVSEFPSATYTEKSASPALGLKASISGSHEIKRSTDKKKYEKSKLHSK
jgi:hypothetical protein